MDQIEKCSVVVCSCEGYKDLWYPFFYCLKKNWTDLRYPLILSTESSLFKMEGLNIITYSMFREGEIVSWSKRLMSTLENIKSEYVILLLDDFLIESPVKSNLLDTYIKYLDENPEIAAFELRNEPTLRNWEIEDNRFEGFSQKKKKTPYRLSAQAGIWRREMLMKCLRSHESIWLFEYLGTIRSRRFKWLFYRSNTSQSEPFDYCGGRLVVRGKYYLPDVERIEKKVGIKIDTEKRGTTTVDWFNMPSRTRKEAILHYLKIKTYIDAAKTLI